MTQVQCPRCRRRCARSEAAPPQTCPRCGEHLAVAADADPRSPEVAYRGRTELQVEVVRGVSVEVARQLGVTHHEAAVMQSLDWADQAAAREDYLGALEWLAAIEAIGEPLSDEQLGKQTEWALAVRAAHA